MVHPAAIHTPEHSAESHACLLCCKASLRRGEGEVEAELSRTSVPDAADAVQAERWVRIRTVRVPILRLPLPRLLERASIVDVFVPGHVAMSPEKTSCLVKQCRQEACGPAPGDRKPPKLPSGWPPCGQDVTGSGKRRVWAVCPAERQCPKEAEGRHPATVGNLVRTTRSGSIVTGLPAPPRTHAPKESLHQSSQPPPEPSKNALGIFYPLWSRTPEVQSRSVAGRPVTFIEVSGLNGVCAGGRAAARPHVVPQS